MVKPSIYHDKSPDELADELAKLKKERFNLRFQRASGQLEKTHRVREVRRDIARVLTTLEQKTRGEIVRATKEKPAKSAARSRVRATK